MSLLDYCKNDRERERVAAVSGLTQSAAAERLGINIRTLERTIAKVKRRREQSFLDGDSALHAGRVHCFIPDCQVTPDTPTDHLAWIGAYIADIQPDVIVNAGDFADMSSLSSYDKGKKSAEGRRVIADFDAANKANNKLVNGWRNAADYDPEMHLTLGNHENRINRACEMDAALDGFLSIENLNYRDTGWTVHDFLKQVVIDGVSYAHYFANPMTGRPYGGANIDTRIKTIGYSFSMGHQQMHMAGQRPLGNGKILRGLVSGACYLHDEEYKGTQGNTHWRGIVIKHEVVDGNYDIMEVSLDYLCRRFEGMPVYKFMEKKYPDIYDHSEWLQRQAARR